MEFIKTRYFNLAVTYKGDNNSDKVAICIPGRLDSKDYINFTSHLLHLASRGYFALAFDPPGTWESPGETNLCTTTNYIKAIEELIKYFGNKSTLLLGHSRGGAAAMLASTNPNVTGLVLIMSAYEAPSHPDNVENNIQIEYRDLPPGNMKTKEQRRFELPSDYFEDGNKYNPLDTLIKCEKPKLLFAGTSDEYYSPSEVREIYDSIPEPKMHHELNTDHNYRYYPDVITEVNSTIDIFLNKYFQK